jgi:hypothetical protein
MTDRRNSKNTTQITQKGISIVRTGKTIVSDYKFWMSLKKIFQSAKQYSVLNVCQSQLCMFISCIHCPNCRNGNPPIAAIIYQ